MGNGRFLTRKIILLRQAGSSLFSVLKTSLSINPFHSLSSPLRKKAGLGAGLVLAFATPLTAIALNQGVSPLTDTTPAFSSTTEIGTEIPETPASTSTTTQVEVEPPKETQSSVNISASASNTSTNLTINGQTIAIEPNTSTHQVVTTPNGQTVTVDTSNSQSSNQVGSYTNVNVTSNSTSASVTSNIGSSYSSP